MPYDSKQDLVQKRRLKTLRLVLPVLIGANASPAAKVLSYDEPSLTFINTQGTSRITLAAGAVDSAAELSAITFAASSDANGMFSVLIRANEPVLKVCSVKLINRLSNEMVVGLAPSGAPLFITSEGDKIVANFDTAVDFSSEDGNFSIEVEYVV